MEGEREIERKLVSAVKAAGGFCPKFSTIGSVGMPDHLVLLPKGKTAFVEVKATGKRPRPLQIKKHKQLEALGFRCYVLDDEKKY